MNDLFRFLVLRPPSMEAPPEAAPVATDSAFQEDLNTALDAEKPRAAVEAVAQAKMAKPDFVSGPQSLEFGPGALDFLAKAEKLPAKASLESARALVRATFETTAEALAANETFQKEKAAVSDSLVAIHVAGAEEQETARSLGALARAFRLIERIAAGDAALSKAGALEQAANAPLVLPSGIFPLPSGFGDAAIDRRKAAAKAQADAARDNAARTKQRELQAARDADITHAVTTLNASMTRTADRLAASAGEGKQTATMAKAPGFLGFLRRTLGSVAATLPTHSAEMRAPAKAMSLQDLDGLDERTLTVARAQGIDVTSGVGTARDVLVQAQQKNMLEAVRSGDPDFFNGRSVRRIGNRFVDDSQSEPATPQFAGGPAVAPDDEAEPPNLSSEHGALEKLTCADLMVVRQALVRYEPGEIAHIENVLAKESRGHHTRRSRTTEDFLSTETETTKEEERDLQTTDRFELQRESQRVIKEDLSVTAGLAISAKYGNVLEVNSNVGVTYNQQKEESSKQASTFSKDVTSRAASKITERVRKLETRRVVEKFAENDDHTFENNTSDDIVGIYQWVDKVYEAQVYNYGARAMYNILVPEPAAFLLDAMYSDHANGEVFVEPPVFAARPESISPWPGAYLRNEHNEPVDRSGNVVDAEHAIYIDYMHYVTIYGVTGVKPPPPFELRVSKTISAKVAGSADGGDADVKEMSISIPSGYIAKEARVTCLYKCTDNNWDDKTAWVAMAIGDSFLFMTPPNFGTQPPVLIGHAAGSMGVTDNAVGVAVDTWNINDYSATVDVVCEWTPELIRDWQLNTHAAITQAYLKLRQEYEDNVANAQARASAVQPWGTNPAGNQKVIATELKKGCISVISEQHFGWVGAIEEVLPDKPHSYPQPDLARLDARAGFIEFVEQAFEWEHMMYFFYPYFWGRKSRWYDKVLIEDRDPLFGEFLKAGAARIVLPVRPGFEAAVAHFIDTKRTWNEGNTGAASPELLSIITEVQASADANGEPPKPVGPSWEVKVPTTLVKLRSQKTLPAWIEKPGGGLPKKYLPAVWDEATKAYIEDPERE